MSKLYKPVSELTSRELHIVCSKLAKMFLKQKNMEEAANESPANLCYIDHNENDQKVAIFTNYRRTNGVDSLRLTKPRVQKAKKAAAQDYRVDVLNIQLEDEHSAHVYYVTDLDMDLYPTD